jgi:superkiller protein 3
MVKNDKAADSTKQDSDPSEIKNDADKTMDTDVLDTHQEEKNHPAESGDEFIAEETKNMQENLSVIPAKRTWNISLTAILETIPKITKILAIFLFITLFSLVTYKEINKDAVVIEPFEVPGALASQGYTGQVIANKFIDQINFIRNRASTTMQSLQFNAAWMEVQPEIHVPQGGEILESILTNIKNYFGDNTTRIIGEVVLRNDRLHVTTRVSGRPAKTFSGQLDELDTVLRQSAEHIYQYTQPYILASYLYDVDKKRSIEIIHHILRRPPPEDDAWAYNLWGLILFDQKDYAGAMAKYRKALSSKIDGVGAHVHAYNNWGLALKVQGRYAEAIAKYKKAVDLDPTHVQAYNGWGRALEDQGDYAGAVDKYRTAIEVDPKDDNAYFNWATALLTRGDYAGAIAKYQQVIDLNPDAVLAYTNWGRALEGQGDYDGAIDKYRAAIAVAPKDDNAYFSWGTALHVQGDYAGAIDKYRKTLELAPSHVRAYNNWGRALEEQGDYAGAIAKYRTAVDLAPKDDNAYLNWGNALFTQRNYKEAAVRFQKAVTLNRNNIGAHFNLGITMAELGNHDEAIAAFQTIIELDPGSENAAVAKNAIDELKKNQK